MSMEVVILIPYSCIIWCMFFITIKDRNDFGIITPKEIYDNSDLNMFACILEWLVLFVFNPLFFIVHFIDFLLHFGRKD